jgi:hypothetical protein
MNCNNNDITTEHESLLTQRPLSLTPIDPAGTQFFDLPQSLPRDVAHDLNIRYNQQNIPIMDDLTFFHLIDEIAPNCSEITEIEQELESRINTKGARLDREYHDAKFTFGLKGDSLFHFNRELEEIFRAGVCNHSIYSFKAFMAHCLPVLVETALKNQTNKNNKKKKNNKRKNSKERMGNNHSRRDPQQVKIQPPKTISKSSPPCRRSARIAKLKKNLPTTK